MPVLDTLGEYQRSQGEFGKSLPFYQRILEIRQQTEGTISLGAARANVALGDLYADWVRAANPAAPADGLKQARQYYQEAIRLLQSTAARALPTVEINEIRRKLDDLHDTADKP